MIGTTVSHYQILDKLGEGGMGVVYKADDTRLRRTVAVKFLRREAIEDDDSRDRFRREAEAAAALDHPNICTIHEIEEADGQLFIVMAFCDGNTVKERIRERPLPLAEALDIAIQTAEALRAAHEKGVVHRDLKPGNLALTAKGQVKVMDFGLAQLSGRTKLTQTGTRMGTPAYMSPEQAQGKPSDGRSDLWSLGVVLYEMVASRLPFRGDTEAAVVHSILHDDPEPVTALRGALPLELDRVLGKALAKDPGERYQHVEDLLVDLRKLRAGVQQESKAERRAAAAARRRLILTASLAGLVVGIAGMGAWVWNRETTKPAPPVVRFSFDLPPGNRIAPTWNSPLGFSPDGQTLAYSYFVGGAAVTFLRRLEGLDVKPLTSAPRSQLAGFSPDGRYLMLLEGATMSLKKAALSGGAPVVFAKGDMPFRGDWAPDNYYYWTDGYFAPIIRTPASGGESEKVTQLDLDQQERAHRDARMMPGGRALTLTVAAGGMDSFDDARIDAYTLDSKRRKTLVQGGFSARYSPSGHLVYARANSLYAVPFDIKTLEVTGSPVKVVEGVFMSTNSGSAYFDISRTGTLAYAVGPAEGGERTLVWVDRQGRTTPLPLPVRSYLFPRISPDGNLIAFEVEGVNHDFYVHDPARTVTTRMSTDGVSHAPVWTPDGRHIAFRSWKAGTMTMWWVPSDRSGPEERLTTAGARQSLVAFTPDGRHATFNQMELGTPMQSDIWILPIQGERKPQPFLKSKSMKGSGRFSPDGKWVVYCSAESGRPEIYVQPWPGPGPRIQVSSEGGIDPIWSHDGRELFYRSGDKMMAVAVGTQPTFRASRPQLLWEGRYAVGMGSSCGAAGATSANYDVTRDGQRFLMVKDMDQDAISTRIVVVLNFAEDLKQLDKEQKH